jgi:hypothetical protein
LDFEFPDTASSFPISLLRIDELEWATSPDPIYVECGRCSAVRVGGTIYTSSNRFFAIPFVNVSGTVDAICTNTSAAFCQIADARFNGSVTKLATYASDGGLLDLNAPGKATRLFSGLTRQIITGNNTSGLKYEKIWHGDIAFADLPAGTLVYEIQPTTWRNHRAAYVRAFLGGLSVPFSPVQFLDGTTTAFERLGISIPPIDDGDDDVVVSRYLPKGEIVANLEDFNYTLGTYGVETPMSTLVDAPAGSVLALELRCSESAVRIDEQCVAPSDSAPAGRRRLSAGYIVLIVIGSIAVVCCIVAGSVSLCCPEKWRELCQGNQEEDRKEIHHPLNPGDPNKEV